MGMSLSLLCVQLSVWSFCIKAYFLKNKEVGIGWLGFFPLNLLQILTYSLKIKINI